VPKVNQKRASWSGQDSLTRIPKSTHQASNSISLSNVRISTENSSKYEDIEECRRLSQNVLDGKKFILCFGQNKDGELGLGHYKEAQKDPRHLNLADDMNAAQSISSGSHHTALVTKTGELYVCGSSLHGKLGLPDLSTGNLNKFLRIPLK
jgi:alpha-tubulin suppressor-like RCC1 family protein